MLIQLAKPQRLIEHIGRKNVHTAAKGREVGLAHNVDLLWINLLGAGGFLAATLPTLGVSMKTLDEDFLSLLFALLVFEIVTLATSLSWFFDAHLEWLAWTEFSIQGLLSHAVLIFIFTFKVTRLI